MMSVPPGTEMFQFPGFASSHYGFMQRYPKGVGCPIRTSTDQRLLAAPRGFSQRATSFIASWCQGIHRMPFHRARSARAGRSARNQSHKKPTPRPCAGTIPGSRVLAPSNMLASEHRPRRRGGIPPPVRHRSAARPETHQNLIHPDKEHTTARRPKPHNQRGRADRSASLRRDISSVIRPVTGARFSALRAEPPTADLRPARVLAPGPRSGPSLRALAPGWRRSDSNRRPPACKAGALPAELRPQNSVGFQLSVPRQTCPTKLARPKLARPKLAKNSLGQKLPGH